ncbi:MAG TPA: DUF975 family protein [Oscillospiraceae bacterium]|nr:DUF975 family protein [Oscillospiraceae bacterium]HQQ89091.1 DUF975 family protein [Oscillospiraceae bacterium]HRW57334.1 DUF975 family protein [Oscillospiraceae bacterium]
MWQRSRLKEEAKRILRRNYWMPFLVTFVFGLISGGSSGFFSGVSSSSSFRNNFDDFAFSSGTGSGVYAFRSFFEQLGDKIGRYLENPAVAISVTLMIIAAIGFAMVISYGYMAFVALPLQVGMRRYFMENRGFKSAFGRLFWAFGHGSYLHIVKIMFIRELKIFLWSLLFVIPGIIKSYEYYMIPYILSENPNISMDRAFELSRRMTQGEKWEIFVMELSFIGWYVLCAFTCGIGFYFLMPYIEASRAELYEVMREKAHGLGFSDFGELPGYMPGQY